MKKKILVIEDEKALRENIATLLSEEGYKVIICKDGVEGVGMAIKIKPDVIICDIMMHPIDGYEVINTLSACSDTKAIPFIFLTAKVEREDIRLGMELGADDYLLKPFKKEELLRAIRVRLKKREMLMDAFPLSPETVNNDREQKYNIDDKIFIRQKGRIDCIKLSSVKYISASNQYSVIHLSDKEWHLMHKTMKRWEELLPSRDFLRIHRSVIINTCYIIKIENWFNNSVRIYLEGIQSPFSVSRRFASRLKLEK